MYASIAEAKGHPDAMIVVLAVSSADTPCGGPACWRWCSRQPSRWEQPVSEKWQITPDIKDWNFCLAVANWIRSSWWNQMIRCFRHVQHCGNCCPAQKTAINSLFKPAIHRRRRGTRWRWRGSIGVQATREGEESHQVPVRTSPRCWVGHDSCHWRSLGKQPKIGTSTSTWLWCKKCGTQYGKTDGGQQEGAPPRDTL